MCAQIKKISKDQLQDIQNREWLIVKLEGNAIPELFGGIPDSVLYAVYASGGPFPGISYSDPSIGTANLIGGIDIFRNSPDDPVAYNKDWYPIITFSDTDTLFLICGPIYDLEHWVDKIPDRFSNAEILAVPPVWKTK